MSSIGQSLVMALTVTVNKYKSSNFQAVPYWKKDPNSSPNSAAAAPSRRGLLLSAAAAASSSLPDSRTLLLQSTPLSLSLFSLQFLSLSPHSGIPYPEYLKKSEENREKNDKERLESYYKRNYKDYFELVEGTIKAKQQAELSDTDKSILDWLKSKK